jgi:hypothetical protein
MGGGPDAGREAKGGGPGGGLACGDRSALSTRRGRTPRRIHFLKAKLNVLLRALELLLKLVRAMLHLLDHARELADLIFQPAHARNHFGVLAAPLLAEQLDQHNGRRRLGTRGGCRERQCGRVAAEACKQGGGKSDGGVLKSMIIIRISRAQ